MMKDLEILRNDPNFVRNYTTGMSHLYTSGVIGVLRQMGGVSMDHSSTMEQLALRGARSNGFQECLDLLMNFYELFIAVKPENGQARMDFGSVRYALDKGYITEEEADAIRRNESININPAKE